MARATKKRASDPKPKRVAVALPAHDEAHGSWLRNFRLSGFTVIILFLVVLAVVVLAPSIRGIVEQQQQVAALKQQLAQQKQDVKTLHADIDRWSDPAYIVAQARDRLLYVYPGDYSYLVIDDGKTPTTDDGAPISASIQTTEVDWLHSLLSTIVTSGTTSQPANQLLTPSSDAK